MPIDEKILLINRQKIGNPNFIPICNWFEEEWKELEAYMKSQHTHFLDSNEFMGARHAKIVV